MVYRLKLKHVYVSAACCISCMLLILCITYPTYPHVATRNSVEKHGFHNWREKHQNNNLSYAFYADKHVATGNSLEKNGFHKWCAKHQRNNLSYTFFADKHLAKEYVKRTVPNLKIATEYNFVSRAEDINEEMLSKLPVKYMFKANHLSGGIAFVQYNVIKCVGPPCPVQNVLTYLQYLRKLCSTWLKTNYGLLGELYYRNIQPKCMFEEMLGNKTLMMDYKIFTFYGKPYFIETDIGRFIQHKRDFYTPNWTRMLISKIPPHLAHNKPEAMRKPVFLEKMLQITEILAQKFSHMRVDFFAYGEEFAFAEFSPSHDNCKGQFVPIVVEDLYGYILEKAAVDIDPEIVTHLFQ